MQIIWNFFNLLLYADAKSIRGYSSSLIEEIYQSFMGLSIKYKIFFAILSAHVLVFMATYVIVKSNFERGFLDYISRIEERQIPALVGGLATFYEKSESWDPIRGNWGKWADLIRESIESTVEPDAVRAFRNNNPISSRITPVRFSPNDWYYTSEYSPARPHLLLLDAEQTIIRGEAQALDLAILNPIIVHSQTVGFLAVTSRQELSEQADLLFSEQQENYYTWVALLLSFFSALIAFPVASFLVRPIKDVVGGTLALTNGDYGSRIKVRSSDELGQLSKDFNTLAKTLEQNRNARQQWIADISHELRTPLAILQGELESVQDGIRPLNPEMLDSLHHEVTHLNSLVNDLHELSMSDLGALVYEKQKIDLAAILGQTIEMHHHLIEQHNINVNFSKTTIETSNLVWMQADPSRLEQLFSNLIQNTCRYTNDGGELNIALKETSSSIVIEWYDSGPGVSDDDLKYLFERLYRVESSRNRKQGGSGLGLTISKNIVAAHDGTIIAEHSTLGGLKITIEFPRNRKPIGH